MSSKEADPFGTPQHVAGAKLDANKPRIGLVLGDFARALQSVAVVGTYGAHKYTDHGWKHVPNGIGRYTDALYRHLLAENIEEKDQESGLLHAACLAWNALARLELLLRASAPELSDVQPPEPASHFHVGNLIFDPNRNTHESTHVPRQ